MVGCVGSDIGLDNLDKDGLGNMVALAEIWQMGFNVDKCKGARLGSKNVNREYFFNRAAIKSVLEKRDFGVKIKYVFKSSMCYTVGVK